MYHNSHQTIHNLTVLNFNANGLKKQRSLFIAFLARHNIDIACISETHLIPTEPFKIAGYKIYRNDRTAEQASGGAAILIKKNIDHYSINFADMRSIEAVAIKLTINEADLTIIAAYKPPGKRWDERDIAKIFNNNDQTLIIGDLNSKNTIWNCRNNNPNGSLLHSLCSKYSMYVSAPNEPTYFPYRLNAEPDILDIVLLKNFRLPITQTVLHELDSDHVPVLISFNCTPRITTPPPKLITGRVDWNVFRDKIDQHLKHVTPLSHAEDIDRAVAEFTHSTVKAVHQATIIKNNNRYRQKSSYPPENILKIIKAKNEARRMWHRTRNLENKRLYNHLNRKVKWELENHRIESYRKYISEIRPGDPTMWQATKRILKQAESIPVISSNGSHYATDIDKCNVFAQHLEYVFRAPAEDEDTRLIKQHVSENLPNKSGTFELTTVEELNTHINELQIKKAPGHDLIPNVVIKNYSAKSLQILTRIFNSCLYTAYFPKTWKHAEVILFHKPGKNKSHPASYRPISLLPTLSKLLEKIIKTRLCRFLSENNILPPQQFGFRSKHSTIHQLQRINELITNGFENKQYTVAVFLDIAQAFDRVWIDGVIYKLLQLNFPPYLIYLLSSFLSQRTFSVRINNQLSENKNISAGVPQGSVIAPILFNIFVSDIPTTDYTEMALYADDTAILSQSVNIQTASHRLQAALNKISAWCKKWKITVNPDKSQAKVFTLKRLQFPQHLKINNQPISWNNKDEAVKYLGIYLDQRLTWGFHINRKLNEAYCRLGMLYPLLNKKSPLKIECAILLYKSIIRPILTYACLVWGTAARTHIRKLQVLQNKILRIICNAPWFIRNSQLHEELALPTIECLIRSVSRKHLANLPACSGATFYGLGQRTKQPRLRRRLPQDIFLTSDENSDENSDEI